MLLRSLRPALLGSCLFSTLLCAEPPSLQDLFRANLLGNASISPDGEHLAAIYNDDKDEHHLLVYNLSTQKPDILRGGGALDLYAAEWQGNDRLLFNVSRDRVYAWGLYVARRDRLGQHHPVNSLDVTHIVGVPRERKHRAWLWIKHSATDRGNDGGVVELNTQRVVENGHFNEAVMRKIAPPSKDPVIWWGADFDGELRYCITYAGGRLHFHECDQAQRTWKTYSFDPEKTIVEAPDPDGRHLWISGFTAESGFTLRRFDPQTLKMEPPVLTDPNYDLGKSRLYFSRQSRTLVGVRYDGRRAESRFFAEPFVTIQAQVEKAYPDTDVWLVDFDDRERRFLFRTGSPQDPGRYIVFDREKNLIQPLTEAAPRLAGKTLLPSHPMAFRTRDGLKLEGYITLPAGASKQTPAPMIVLLHGGPAARDTWSFDAEVQFLAQRGYAVLQPNYRGSTGYRPEVSVTYAYDFKKMHNDVTDSVDAALSTGMVDRSRIGIMGGSFGGFLALAGVAFEPGRYRCAVSNCGVFDWEQIVKDTRASGRPGAFERLVAKLGTPGDDTAKFAAISPLSHVAAIKAPVFIAHGQDDGVVDVAQSKRLAAALRKQGVPHETFFRAFEGHGFYSHENRVEFYEAVERFLAVNLAPTAKPPASTATSTLAAPTAISSPVPRATSGRR